MVKQNIIEDISEECLGEAGTASFRIKGEMLIKGILKAKKTKYPECSIILKKLRIKYDKILFIIKKVSKVPKNAKIPEGMDPKARIKEVLEGMYSQLGSSTVSRAELSALLLIHSQWNEKQAAAIIEQDPKNFFSNLEKEVKNLLV